MTIDELVKIIDAITKLISVLAWPALLVFVLIRFGPAVRDFFSSLGEFTFKGGGFEASAKRKQAEAAAALVAATVARPEEGATPEATAREARGVANVVAEAATPRVIKRARESTVLWVDDRPNNNIYERQALEALGINFVISTSTEDALDKISRKSFDAIISDMGRPPDSKAGYTLLDNLKASGNNTPYIIYAGSRKPEHTSEARRRGAIGCTNRPDELFQMVLSAIGQKN